MRRWLIGMQNTAVRRHPLTDIEHMAKHGSIVHGGAVPAPIFELILALVDSQPSAASDVGDVVLVEVAQLGLPLGQSFQLGAGQLLFILLGASSGRTRVGAHRRDHVHRVDVHSSSRMRRVLTKHTAAGNRIDRVAGWVAIDDHVG